MTRLCTWCLLAIGGLLLAPALGQATITTSATPATVVLSSSATLGDVATLSGLTAAQATGTVDFRLFDPADTTCTGAPIFESLARPITLNADLTGGTATSEPFTPIAVGDYRWTASYSGDVNNPPEATLCNDPGETQTVTQALPAIGTVAAGVTLGAGDLTDTATVTGLVNPALGQSVTFRLYGPGDTTCATPLVEDPEPLTLDLAQTSGSAQSAPFTPTAAGEYRWVATYDGDPNNAPVAGVCGDPTETVTVAKATPVITSQASGAIALRAGVLTDTATVAGVAGAVPNGSVTFQLYGPDDASCSGGSIFTDTRGVTAAGPNATATSAAFTPTVAGVYRWRAVYSGDADYNAAAAPCNANGESVAVGPAAPPATPPPAAVTPPPPPPPPPPAAAPANRPVCNGRIATIVGTGQAELAGTAGPDVIVGGDRAESIEGGGGDDTICAGKGADKVDGGSGQDVIFGEDGDDRLRGGAGNDRVFGDRGADLVLGGTGDDDVHGGSGKDRLAGNAGFDRVEGDAGNDVLDEQELGGAGRDRLLGGSGGDTIRTRGGGADVVDCGSGRDIVVVDRTDRRTGCESVRR